MLSILAFVLTLSLKLSSAYHSLSARAELNRLQTVITYLRRKAIITQQSATITFHQDGYTADRTWHLSSGVEFGSIPGVKGPPSDPKKPLSSAITFCNNRLELFPDGSVSAGAIYMTDASRSCLYALTSDASAFSGIRCYRYREKWEPV